MCNYDFVFSYRQVAYFEQQTLYLKGIALEWFELDLLNSDPAFHPLSMNDHVVFVMVENPPISFLPFTLAHCMLFSHFSFNDFITTAFPDLAEDWDIQI